MVVKKPRPYDSSRRRELARLARERVLDAARERFLRDGFGLTTVSAVAADAEVSVDTIYKSFGNKPGLVRALCERELGGAGPEHAERRSERIQANGTNPQAMMRALGALAAEVSARVAPLHLLIIAAAAVDPEMARLWGELDRSRLERMTDNARRLARRGLIREGLSIERAAEVMWTYSSPELYRLLVKERGWSVEEHGAFIAAGLSASLLAP